VSNGLLPPPDATALGIRERGGPSWDGFTPANRRILMFALMTKFRQLMQNDRRGVTALEYGLIAALVAGVVITAVSLLGTNLSSTFNGLATQLSSATG
jgi:pilus assembly protein Flp/PilA